MRLFLLIAPIVALAQFCQVEEFGVGTGSITLHNSDKTTQEIVISDTSTCFAGLRTEINSNATRTFGIADEAYLCVGGGGGVALKDGGSYVIRGGAASPAPH